MKVLEFILSLYSKDLERIATFNGEIYSAWFIDGMSKNEVIDKYSKEEIEAIYFSGL